MYKFIEIVVFELSISLQLLDKSNALPKIHYCNEVKRVNSLTCSQVKKARKRFRQTNRNEEIFDKLTIIKNEQQFN